MDSQQSESEPVTLDYQPSRPVGDSEVKYVSMGALVGVTGLFAVSHWVAEYVCQSVYHFRDVQRGSYAYVRAADAWWGDMVAETFTIALCSAAFLIVQGLFRPGVAVRVRGGAWVAAAVAGLVFCLGRWLIWFV